MVDAKDIPELQHDFNELWKLAKKWMNCSYEDIDTMMAETRKLYFSTTYDTVKKGVIGLINDIERAMNPEWRQHIE